MRRVYRNVHIALITALVLVAVAFEATANEHVLQSGFSPVLAESVRGDR